MSDSSNGSTSESSSIRAGSVPEVPDKEFRRLIRKVVPYLLDKFEVFGELTDPHLPAPFLTRYYFHNLTAAIYISSHASQDQWKPFFLKHYERMSSSLNMYMQYIFYVLDRYENHFNNVFACLLSSMTFVTSATVFFTEKGYTKALRCSYKILFSFFESRLRDRFYSQGGFAGLFEHIEDIQIYRVLHFTCYNVIQLEFPPWHYKTLELRDAFLQYLPKLDEIEGSVVESDEISASRSTVAIEIKAVLSLRKMKSQRDFCRLRDEVIKIFQEYVKPITPKDQASALPAVFASVRCEIPSAIETPTVHARMDSSKSVQKTRAPEKPALRVLTDDSKDFREEARGTLTSRGKIDGVSSIGNEGVEIPRIPLGSSHTPSPRGLVDRALLTQIEKAIDSIKARNVKINENFNLVTEHCRKFGKRTL